jgi:ornithine carbamoyltransferase
MTIREKKGALEGLKLAYIGDGNNMANSLIVGGVKTGMKVSVASPAGYEPDAEIMKWALGTGRFAFTNDVSEAAAGADVIYTDVWASMGQESEAAKRRVAFEGVYQINEALMKLTNERCMVQHCLPAHRGEEITSDVFEAHADEIFDEAENRLHAQKALMVKLMKD